VETSRSNGIINKEKKTKTAKLNEATNDQRSTEILRRAKISHTQEFQKYQRERQCRKQNSSVL